MLIDTHVHVGKFDEKYFSPSYISTLMRDCQVDKYLVSSTSTCVDDFSLAISEISELIKLDGKKIIPCLWLTEVLMSGDGIKKLLNSNIKWRCIKIHPALRSWEWNPSGSAIEDVFKLSSRLGNIPVLIHTGHDDCCKASNYKNLIQTFPYIPVILAHGRPLHESKQLLAEFDNTFVDTAFMPVEDIIELVNDGFSKKLLWGTDFCIPQIFDPTIVPTEYYQNKLSNLKQHISLRDFRKVTFENASLLFND